MSSNLLMKKNIYCTLCPPPVNQHKFIVPSYFGAVLNNGNILFKPTRTIELR